MWSGCSYVFTSTLCFLLLVCVPGFVPASAIFNTVALQCNLKRGIMISPALLCWELPGWSRISYGTIKILGLFLLTLWRVSLKFWWTSHWIYKAGHFQQYSHFCNIDPAIPEHRWALHLWVTSSVSFFRTLKFSVLKSFTSLVRFTPGTFGVIVNETFLPDFFLDKFIISRYKSYWIYILLHCWKYSRVFCWRLWGLLSIESCPLQIGIIWLLFCLCFFLLSHCSS